MTTPEESAPMSIEGRFSHTAVTFLMQQLEIERQEHSKTVKTLTSTAMALKEAQKLLLEGEWAIEGLKAERNALARQINCLQTALEEALNHGESRDE